MKPFLIFCLGVYILLLSSCMVSPEELMTKFTYTPTINLHTNKTAYLSWKDGYQIDTNFFRYGTAQQAVFMTSLRDVLSAQKVFKKIYLGNNINQPQPSDVFIDIYFKSTRIQPKYFFKVILDVELTIKTFGKPEFKRTYIIESDIKNEKNVSFKGQQLDASEKLLAKVIKGIKTGLT